MKFRSEFLSTPGFQIGPISSNARVQIRANPRSSKGPDWQSGRILIVYEFSSPKRQFQLSRPCLFSNVLFLSHCDSNAEPGWLDSLRGQ